MKILILRAFPNKVNLNSYNLQEIGLAKALIKKGHQCDVAYFGGWEKDHDEMVSFAEGAVRVIWLRGFGILMEGFYPTLHRYIDGYDIIQVSEYVGITSCWLNMFYQHKVINYHGPYYCKENRKDILKAAVWDRTLLPLSRKKKMVVMTKSPLATEYLLKKGIKNVTTVGVGLDVDNILGTAQETCCHEFVEFLQSNKGNNKFLLYVGAMEERRNIQFLLETFAKVSESKPECRLILIGKGTEEYLAKCERKIDQLGIRQKVYFREKIEQKYLSYIYKLSDMFLLPTRYEIFGMVLLEAMYFGLPVITTYNGGSSVLINQKNGVVIPELDVELWAGKVLHILSDRTLCIELGNRAHTTIEQEYTWDALSEKFENEYAKKLRISECNTQM